MREPALPGLGEPFARDDAPRLDDDPERGDKLEWEDGAEREEAPGRDDVPALADLPEREGALRPVRLVGGERRVPGELASWEREMAPLRVLDEPRAGFLSDWKRPSRS